MALTPWVPGMALTPPVYVDANVLVGYLVSGHRLYPSAAALFADLLAGGMPIVLSDITVDESVWVLAMVAYCDSFGHKYNVRWTKNLYLKWHGRIFPTHAATVGAVRSLITSLDAVGHPIDVIHPTKAEWLTAMDKSLAYMEAFQLTPADAAHLAFAGDHARTFITGDGDYATVSGPTAPANLDMLHVT